MLLAPGDPTYERATAAIAAGTLAGDLTGVELLALFELKAEQLKRASGSDGARAAALAMTYGQEARQRYTEALAHQKGVHNPVDLEALDREGITAGQERERWSGEFRGESERLNTERDLKAGAEEAERETGQRS